MAGEELEPLPEKSDFKATSLDDLISEANPEGEPGKVEAEAPPEPEKPEGEVEAKGDKPAEEAGQGEPPASPDQGQEEPPEGDKPKGDAPATVPAHVIKAIREDAKATQAEMKAHIARQDAEIAELRKPQRPDEYEDPEGAREYDRNEQDSRRWKDRVDISQEVMREIHEDYDEVEAVFRAEAVKNPALQAQLAAHPLPAKFAYQEGKRLQQVQAMGDDPAAYIERIKDEAAKAAREAVLEELKRQGQAVTNASVPDSLAEAPSAPQKGNSGWDGPKPLGEILGERS